MKILSKTDSNNKISKAGIVINICLILLCLILAGFVYFILPNLLSREYIDLYSANVFPFIAFIFNSISNVFITSLTEMFAVVGSVVLVIAIIYFLIKCICVFYKQGANSFLKYFLTRLKKVSVLILIGTILFQLMIGINYNRTPIASKLNINGHGYEYEQYYQTLNWAYNGMIEARKELGEDYNGVAHMSTSFEEAVYDANSLINTVAYYYDLDMSINYVRAKPVMLSHLWSYTDITGFYDAFLGEANLNVDYMDILYFPVTLCHEIIHAKGYSREYDANTAAVISCIESPRADFRYAGFFYIFIHLYGTTLEYAEHEGLPLPEFASLPDFEMVRRDLRASDMYEDTLVWNALTDFINSFSEDVNNTYLESNGQEGGTDTYRVPPNLYVDFYYRYIEGAGNVSN